MRSHYAKLASGLCAALSIALVGMGCEQFPMEPSPEDSGGLVAAGEGNGKLNHASVCNLHSHDFTLDIDNEFFPMPVGRQWVLEGEEDGEEIRVEITVLDETEVVGGIVTRVVEEREFVDDELEEVSRNFFAQVENKIANGQHAGTLCYFGESEDPPAPGEWRADEPGSRPGIFMPADPQIGMVFQQEDGSGAQDRAGIIGRGEEVTVPFGTFSNTVLAQDCNPIEDPGCDPLEDGDLKVYVSGIGIIADAEAELIAFTP